MILTVHFCSYTDSGIPIDVIGHVNANIPVWKTLSMEYYLAFLNTFFFKSKDSLFFTVTFIEFEKDYSRKNPFSLCNE